MSEDTAATTAPIERMVIRAVESGNRIDAYDPIIDWLMSGPNPESHARQFAESLIYRLHEAVYDHDNPRAAEALRKITDSALSSERAVCHPTH